MSQKLNLYAYRHGQSVANTGLSWPDAYSIPLTDLGHKQALLLADNWAANHAPDLIVTSNMLRSQQTAQPTAARFSDVAVEVWLIQEFCYLTPEKCSNTTWQQRQPWVDKYWQDADPYYCDGVGAESFVELMQRVNATLYLLNERQKQGYLHIALFGHGQFLSVMLDSLREKYGLASSKHMMEFRARELQQPIPNAQRFAAQHQHASIRHNLEGWDVTQV